jgi:hypothetical protein
MPTLSHTPTLSTSVSPVQAGKRSWLNYSRNYLATAVAISFFFLSFFTESLFTFFTFSFLIAGFIFPGMAHGSLDYYLVVRSSNGKVNKSTILFSYIGIIGLILAAWYISPLFVLMVFLLNSAYHFGETDLQHSTSHPILRRLVYGVLVLLFFFSSHSIETQNYLSPFGIDFPVLNSSTALFVCATLLISIAAILRYGVNLRNSVNVLLVLLIGTKLPLLLAFGIYYILVHSTSAWNDLKEGLELPTASMLKIAGPFTMAGILFILFAGFLFQQSVTFHDQPVPLIIMGLAAITLPHTISMSIFYRKLYKQHQ